MTFKTYNDLMYKIKENGLQNILAFMDFYGTLLWRGDSWIFTVLLIQRT